MRKMAQEPPKRTTLICACGLRVGLSGLLNLLLKSIYHTIQHAGGGPPRIETATRRPPHPVWFQACTVRGCECGVQWSLAEYSHLP